MLSDQDLWSNAHAACFSLMAERNEAIVGGRADPALMSRSRRENTASGLTPERLYERHWALTLLEHALARLREEFAAAGQTRQFNQLRGFLTTEAAESSYAAAAAKLGMTTGAAGKVIHRLRLRYRELVREEIAQTVGSPAEVEDEIRWLFGAVG